MRTGELYLLRGYQSYNKVKRVVLVKMVSKSLTDIMHFYYCLSIAIKINKRLGANKTPIHTNIFVLKWLDNAKKDKIFNDSVNSEIKWLAHYIKSKGPLFQSSEKLIYGIYDACLGLLREKVSLLKMTAPGEGLSSAEPEHSAYKRD